MENTTDTAMDFFMANRSLSTFQMMVAYANSVRPEVVVPQYVMPMNDAVFSAIDYQAWFDCIQQLRRLNPSMTFTELNHEK